jgi:hypothetical protein
MEKIMKFEIESRRDGGRGGGEKSLSWKPFRVAWSGNDKRC